MSPFARLEAGEWGVHRDGIPWDEAPLPGRLHRCHPWTTMRSGGQSYRRCACGAEFVPGAFGGWVGKNSRRQSKSWFEKNHQRWAEVDAQQR